MDWDDTSLVINLLPAPARCRCCCRGYHVHVVCPVKNPAKVWVREADREIVARDEWGKPGEARALIKWELGVLDETAGGFMSRRQGP